LLGLLIFFDGDASISVYFIYQQETITELELSN